MNNTRVVARSLICVGVLSTAWIVRGEFSASWALVPESLRPALLDDLRQRGQTNAVALLTAGWDDDAIRFAAAARAILAEEWDPAVASLLAQCDERLGQTDEARVLRSRMAAAHRNPAAYDPQSYEPQVSTNRPVVFLHGYGDVGSRWNEIRSSFDAKGYCLDDQLVFRYYAFDFGSGEGCAEGIDRLEDSFWTPIQDLAEKVAANTRIWLRRRAGLADDDASHDDELPAPDWVAHSMGGLVFRCVAQRHPELVHRCVDLGTPHFGQPISAKLFGEQTVQMKYGSSFLWNLDSEWNFCGKDCRDMIFIAGIAMTDKSVYWDGLVPAFSSTMLTDGNPAFSNRTFYVNRVHAPPHRILGGEPYYQEARDSENPTQDTVFRLIYGYFHDTDYFADGHVPSSEQLLKDDEMDEAEIPSRLDSVRKLGGLFVQVVEPGAASTNALPAAISYQDGGALLAEDIIHSLTDPKSGESIEITRTSGNRSEGCANGLEMLFADIPEGDYEVAFNAPSDNPQEYAFSNRCVKIHGGGVTMIRARPWGAVACSASDFTDDRGRPFTLVTTNAWLVQAGAALSEEDLAGCAAAACQKGANGYPLAVSAWLGLDPNAATSVLEVVTFGLSSPKTVDLRMATDGRLREPLDASVRGPVFVPQGRTSLGTGWMDLTERIDVPGDKTLWRYPTTSNRFFRVVARPSL